MDARTVYNIAAPTQPQLWAPGEVEQPMDDMQQEVEQVEQPMEQPDQPMAWLDQPMAFDDFASGTEEEDIGDGLRPHNKPIAEMAMVVGKYRVPIRMVSLPDETGNFVFHSMVQFTQRSGATNVSQWLWPLLGFSAKQSHQARDPWRLPLMIEIIRAVAGARKKRMRGGGHTDATGRVLPQLMDVCVRGQSLLVENNVKRLSVNLGDLTTEGPCPGEPKIMNWFLKQLWEDRRHVRADVPPDGEHGAIRSPSSWEIMDAPQKHIVQTALDKVLATRLCKYAQFYPVSGRFRVQRKDKSVPKWFGVRRFKKLFEDNDNDGLETALTIGAVSIVRYLEEDYDAPGAVPGPGFRSLDSENGELIHD